MTHFTRIVVSLILFVSLWGAWPLTVHAAVVSPCQVAREDMAKTPAPSAKPTMDGRLGGSHDSFTKFYGKGRDQGNGDLSFTWKGCGPLTGVQFYKSRAIDISLWANRPDDIEKGDLSAPHEADWSMDEATVMAARLLPSDAVLDEPTTTDAGNTAVLGTSEALASNGSDGYEYVPAAGAPGEFQVIYSLDKADEVFSIEIQLRGYGEDVTAFVASAG